MNRNQSFASMDARSIYESIEIKELRDRAIFRSLSYPCLASQFQNSFYWETLGPLSIHSYNRIDHESNTASGNQNQNHILVLDNIPRSEVELRSVVDKKIFEHRNIPVRIEDLNKILKMMAALEINFLRSFRSLQRIINKLSAIPYEVKTELNRLVDKINTITEHLDLSTIESIPGDEEGGSEDVEDETINNSDDENPSEVSDLIGAIELGGRDDDDDDEDEEEEEENNHNNPPAINVVEALWSTGQPRLKPFNGDGTVPFSSWRRKFQDVIDADNTVNTEAAKLGCLKYLLDGFAREKFDQLAADDRDTLAHALEALRGQFDSPQIREVARQK